MVGADRYRVNRPAVTSDTFDSEVIVLNLESGNYYSLERTGAEVWDLLDRQASVEEIADALASAYDGEPGAIRKAVVEFIAQLRDEALIVPAVAASRGSGAPEPPRMSANGASPERVPFSAPVLRKFTDLQDLLLLDPIHEVDEAGWPMRPAE